MTNHNFDISYFLFCVSYFILPTSDFRLRTPSFLVFQLIHVFNINVLQLSVYVDD